MELKTFLKENYNLDVVSHQAMAGYASANFRIITTEGKKYVLKLHKPEKNIKQRLEAEHNIFKLLNSATIQAVFKNKEGKEIVDFTENGFQYARLISYLEGIFYAELDFDRVLEERQNFDPVGHYSRPDVTQLVVNRERQGIVKFTNE